MKLLLDFLPIVLFFLTFKWAEGEPETASIWASEHLGFLVQGGQVGAAVAPVLLATVVVMAATAIQVLVVMARGRRVDPMLWVSLALVVVLGAATVWFHSETFIKWKPTALYWAFGGALLAGRLVWRRNVLQVLMGGQLQLPEPVWTRLNWAWCLFFVAMGLLNIWVAYTFDTAVWVNFKLFGGIGLLLAFALGQALYLSPHLEDRTES